MKEKVKDEKSIKEEDSWETICFRPIVLVSIEIRTFLSFSSFSFSLEHHSRTYRVKPSTLVDVVSYAILTCNIDSFNVNCYIVEPPLSEIIIP